MRLVGTVSKEPTEEGFYTLRVHGMDIPIRRVYDTNAGKRVIVHGNPRWSHTQGSFFRVSACHKTDRSDMNDVIVEGTIVKIMPERKNPRNRRSACIVVKTNERAGSKVLVTALSSKVDVLGMDSLSVGDHICLSGYIAYHDRGLHVLYQGTLREKAED